MHICTLHTLCITFMNNELKICVRFFFFFFGGGGFRTVLMTDIGSCCQWQMVCISHLREKIPNPGNKKKDSPLLKHFIIDVSNGLHNDVPIT